MIPATSGGSSASTYRGLLALATGIALVLTACAGNGDKPVQVGGIGSGAGSFDSHRGAPAAPIEGAAKGGTVTVLTNAALGHNKFDCPCDTLDPTGSYFLDTSSVLSGLVTRSLTQYVYDPDSGSMVLVPDLATDLGRSNADFTEWSFTIRDGIRFEDGSKVGADDIAYGIKRSFDRAAFKNSGPAYSTDYFLDGASYKGPYVAGTKYSGVVVDGNTLTIKMARPFPDMPYWAAFPAMGPIPELGSDPATYWRHPMATGPYKVQRYAPSKSLTLVRNDQWDPATDPGRHAYPDRYIFRFFQDPDRTQDTILGDSAQGRTALSYDSESAATSSTAQRLGRLTSGLGPCTDVFWPDNRKITDIRVREALGYAFPYRRVAARYGGALGVTALPGAAILPPGLPGRQDYAVLDAPPGATRPQKAKALLRRAGFAPGEYPITFAYADARDVAVNADYEEQLVKGLHAAGFATHPIRTTNSEDFVSIQDDPHAPINVRFYGWCSDWPSGSSWIPQIFASTGEANNAYFSQPSVDGAIDRIGRLQLDQQPAAWGSLDKEIMTRYYPGVVLSYPGLQMLHGASIGGMNDDTVNGMPTWKDIYVVD